tara:strand:+ start:157 stop:768 length:612 start_codon:yes stop_codon:yes gene_type:complete
MTDFLDVLIVLLVLVWLWTRFKKYKADKQDDHQHEHNNKQDEALAVVVVKEDRNSKLVVDEDVDGDIDYLQLAAEKGREAKLAMREKNNAEAWELIQQQKHFYSQLTDQQTISVTEMIGLDSNVSKDLANLLRLEKKHKDALVHIIYWVANSKSVTKDQESKLRAYFNRSKLTGPTVNDVMDYCLAAGIKEFHVIQKDVDSWV